MLDLPAMEREILAFWAANDTFAASLQRTAGGQAVDVLRGPAHRQRHAGHPPHRGPRLQGRVPPLQDHAGLPRRAARPAGTATACPSSWPSRRNWASTASPTSRRTASRRSTRRCRESVSRHVDAFTELTERMGYWVNLDEAYWTMSPDYVESVWWALKQIHTKGLLVEDYRVAPYCPRCGTTLSDHELAQGYEDVTDPTVYVRFPLTSGPLAGKASLLVWTTTPWTLVSNTAVAVHPDVTYVVATRDAPAGETPGRRRAAGREGARRRLAARPRPSPAANSSSGATPVRSIWSSSPTSSAAPTTWCWPTTSPPRTAPAWSTRRPRSARTTWRSAARTGCRW